MCGIAGYFLNSVSLPSSVDMSATKDAICHRGPDDFGFFEDFESGVGFVHTRLSILDLSPLGHQPMLSKDKRVSLVFNGEIYNFRELRSELETLGHDFVGYSDTEVLLHMYLDWREHGGDLQKVLQRLNGMFAFAIWDADLGALLVARDAFGVKPLYYSEDGNGFAFASEIKALETMVNTNGPIDAAAVHRYLSFLWCPGDGTPLEGLRKLGPGEFLWVKQGVVAEKVTWYRSPTCSYKRQRMDKAAAIAGTGAHLRKAVHRQLISDVPVGAFLSGGLDSSSVVAFAKEVNPEIHCFTIESAGGAEAGAIDDLPYAKRVAAHLNVPLDVVRVDSSQMVKNLAEMVAHLDEPLADPAPLNVMYISQLARESGIKVLLSGAGGDDLFTGYRRHQAVLTERYWDWFPRPVRSGLARISSGLDQRWLWARRLRKAFDGAALDGDARLVNYFIWSRREDLLPLYTPEFRVALGEAEANAPMMDFLAELPSEIAPLQRMLALEQRFFLTDHNLTYTDKMSMAAGVEVRVPFLDLDLVEFASTIPTCLKQRGRHGKWVLKKAMEHYLPLDVIYRPKSGFGAPLRRWMRVELRELLEDILGEASLRNRGLFNATAVRKLIDMNDSGRVDASYTLLSLICVELWCRRFMDGVVQ